MNIRFFLPFSKSYFTITFIFFPLTAIFTPVFGEGASCQKALKIAFSKKFEEEAQLYGLSKSQCPLTHDFSMWMKLQKSGTFSQIQTFVKDHPSWPRQETLRIQAEKDLFSGLEKKGRLPLSTTKIINWFDTYQPLSYQGLICYTRASQERLAKNKSAQQRLYDVFLNLKVPGKEIQQVIHALPGFFSESIIYEKVSQYLTETDTTSAKVLLGYLSTPHKKIVEHRIALQTNGAQGHSLLDSPFAEEPEFIYEWIRVHRKAERNDEAKELIQQISQNEKVSKNLNEMGLWTERNLLSRRYLEQKNPQKAYDVLVNHGLTKGENFAHAEFMLGWICLQFLKNPEQALLHFEKLQEGVKLPISVARATYWLGKTHQALEDKDQAKQWFGKSKKHEATYYGQLAHKELHGSIPKIKPIRLVVDKQTHRRFQNREFVRLIKILVDAKKPGLAESFAVALAQEIETEKEQYLLVDFLKMTLGNGTAVEIYKKSIKSTAPLFEPAYPRLSYVSSKLVNPAFAHAIIRQESRFKSDAVSSAGAMGLMQLMPATAAKVVKTHKIKKNKLTNPKHNVIVGSYHLKELLNRYNGSMILAAASYNAGAQPVDEWIVKFGDPRHPNVDAVDWVESIPYVETRNYVQRVMENYHYYR